MRFSRDEVGIFRADGSLVDNAMLSFAVRTPFCAQVVTYTKSELEQLADNDFKPTNAKKTDTNWLQFYIYPSTLNASDETMQYYSDTGADLLSLEQFLYKLMLKPDEVFNDKTKECKVTVFANEYFYDRNPIIENASEDKNLWKTFANAEERTFDLLVNNTDAISPDGESRYHQSLVSIRQMSIKTIFVDSPEGMRIWGIENINEAPDLDFSAKGTLGADAFYNKYYSNGWQNTWTIMAKSGNYQQEVMCDPMGRGKQNALWKAMTKTENGKLALSRDHTNAAAPNFHASYACFSPFLRNRDDNRDGQMQASEMKWYIPSVAETALIYIGERALPLRNRLYGHAPSNSATAFYTSKSFMGSTNLTLNSPNAIIFIAESQSMTPLHNFAYHQNGNKPGERTPYSDVRLIRDLGILDSDTKSYHMDELGQEQKKGLLNEWTLDSYLTFKADNISPKCLRAQRSSYELPSHDEKSQVNTIYKSGFEVAKYLANKIDKPKNLSRPNVLAEYYWAPWLTLQNNIEHGNSPCAYYYQEADRSDLGTWRVPNQVELEVMCGFLFDWDSREAKERYTFGSNILPTNATNPAIFHSRTGYSRIEAGGAKSFPVGYQLYTDGYLRYVTTVDTQWVVDKGVNKSGYVRCVRDLP